MKFDDIAAELPAPRDDEPESLRRDIVDELADHLHCSLNRELLGGGQASPGREPRDSDVVQTAWQQVLHRFGNPATIARRLWWDAMQEKIMAQRITAILAGITAAAAVVMAVLLWRGIEQQAQVTTALQESNAALLERLVAALEQQPAGAPADAEQEAGPDRTLRHLQLQLVLDEPGGPPAVGYQLNVAGVSEDDSLVRLVDPQTDEQGRATASMNRIGVFYVRITTPHGESASTRIPMGPEHPDEVELVVPSSPKVSKDLVIKVPTPDALADESYLHELTIARRGHEDNGLQWYDSSNSRNTVQLLVADDGRVLGEIAEVEGRGRSIDGFNGSAPSTAVFKLVPFDGLAAGDYAIDSIAAYRPYEEPGDGPLLNLLAENTGAGYRFARGTTVRTISPEGDEWTIPMPEFSWKREIDGDLGENLSGGGGGGGGGFF